MCTVDADKGGEIVSCELPLKGVGHDEVCVHPWIFHGGYVSYGGSVKRLRDHTMGDPVILNFR